MSWIFRLDPWLLALLVVTAYLTVGLAGLVALRSRVRRAAGGEPALHNSTVAAFISPVGTLCGLLLGLVAVTAWRGHSEAESLVTREATTLAALYRDMGAYPEPARGELRALAREYLRFTIEDAWPAQRECRVPPGGGRANALFTRLAAFEPATPRETVAHQEAMRAFNVFFEARRERVDAVTRGLPATLWCVVVASGLILIAITWLYAGPSLPTQVLLTTGLSTLVGLLVFVIVALDRPFCGPMGASASHFELVRDQLMRQ